MASQTQKEIKEIKERNKRVEADKAWETSWTRRAMITIATYITIVVFLFTINAPDPWLNAMIPAGAFLLSTLTLPPIKKIWVEHAYKK